MQPTRPPAAKPSRARTDRLQELSGHPAGPALLLLMGVAEATVFPAPTEAMLVVLVLAIPTRAAWWIALAVTGSVAGGALGYAAGASLFQAWAGPVAEWSGSARWLDAAGTLYRENYALALVTSGFTPVPYLVYTGAAGAAGVPFAGFVVFSLVGRALKYGAVGLLALALGPAVRRVLDRLGPGLAVAVVAALLVAYYLASR